MTLDIQAIRERCEKATPGPWEHTELSEEEVYVTVGYTYENGRHKAHWIAQLDDDTDATTDEERYENAEFIAHARTDLQRALDEIERLQKEHEVEQGVSNELSARLNDAHAEIEHLRTAIQQVIPRMNDVGLFNSVEILERALRGDSHDN